MCTPRAARDNLEGLVDGLRSPPAWETVGRLQPAGIDIAIGSPGLLAQQLHVSLADLGHVVADENPVVAAITQWCPLLANLPTTACARQAGCSRGSSVRARALRTCRPGRGAAPGPYGQYSARVHTRFPCLRAQVGAAALRAAVPPAARSASRRRPKRSSWELCRSGPPCLRGVRAQRGS